MVTASRSSARATTRSSTASPGSTSPPCSSISRRNRITHRQCHRSGLPRPEPTDLKLLGDALRERTTSPQEIVRGVRAALRGPRQVMRGVGATSKMVSAGMAAPSTPFNVEIGPHRRVAFVRSRPRRAETDQGRSTAARSTTSSSRSSPARSATTCAPAATTPRTSRCGRWCRSASAPRRSTARSATGSRR